jgi:hypothetical protein
MDNTSKDSFVIYMCVSGKGVKLISEEFEEIIKIGETILFPAKINQFEIIPIGMSELLEIYIS